MAIPLDVKGLVQEFMIPGGLFVLRAAQAVQNSYGEWVAQAEVPILFRPIAVHNYSGRDLLLLPEADRNAETIRVYTWSRLHAQDGGQAADILMYRGRRWKITQALDYELQGEVYISTGTLQDVQQPIP